MVIRWLQSAVTQSTPNCKVVRFIRLCIRFRIRMGTIQATSHIWSPNSRFVRCRFLRLPTILFQECRRLNRWRRYWWFWFHRGKRKSRWKKNGIAYLFSWSWHLPGDYWSAASRHVLLRGSHTVPKWWDMQRSSGFSNTMEVTGATMKRFTRKSISRIPNQLSTNIIINLGWWLFAIWTDQSPLKQIQSTTIESSFSMGINGSQLFNIITILAIRSFSSCIRSSTGCLSQSTISPYGVPGDVSILVGQAG